MRLVVLLVVSLVAAGLAGCVKGGDPSAQTPPTTADADVPPSFALPDDRGVSSAANETNATEAGAGGIDHKHDYWRGHDQVVIFAGSVAISTLPIFPEGEGSTPKGVGYLKLGGLPEDPATHALVYEGADKVTVFVKSPTVRGQAVPATIALTIQHMTAATSEWSEPRPLAYDQPFEIPVASRETDMPHSTQSLWNFRFVSDKPPTFASVNVTVTVSKGGEVVDWPGHPDFYADRSERVVLDRDVKTHVYGFPENSFYEGMDAFEIPDKLISYGTSLLDVYVNVSGFSSTAPVSPTEYFLYAHNATDLGITCCPEGFADVDARNDLKTYHFQVPVEADAMDGPYQPVSRWGFYVAARVGAPIPVSHGFTDGASYDVVYHMTIVARKAETPTTPSA